MLAVTLKNMEITNGQLVLSKSMLPTIGIFGKAFIPSYEPGSDP